MSEGSATRAGKNIVILSDGTGREGGADEITNVGKLFDMIEDRTGAQVAFYDRGIGTGWRRIAGNLLGAGISTNILDAYQFISDHYRRGDRIFLFGFGRGALTVRSLSGFVSMFGLLPASRPELARAAYAIFRRPADTENAARRRLASRASFLKRNATTFCDIRFLGVWDTVAALAVPIRTIDAILSRLPFTTHSLHDLRLSPCVRTACHALSIDDEREAFHPTPWQTIDDEGNSLLGEVPAIPGQGRPDGHGSEDRRQVVRQVWFCGVHADVGGGYEQHGISDIPLVWMIDQARHQGLKLDPGNEVRVEQDVEDVIHDPLGAWHSEMFYRRRTRTWDAARCGRLVVHESVLRRKRGKKERAGLVFDDVAYQPWVLDGEVYDVEPWTNEGCRPP